MVCLYMIVYYKYKDLDNWINICGIRNSSNCLKLEQSIHQSLRNKYYWEKYVLIRTFHNNLCEFTALEQNSKDEFALKN